MSSRNCSLPNLYDIVDENGQPDTVAQQTILAVTFTMGILSVLGNSLVIATCLFNSFKRRIRRRINIFVCNLSLADLCIGVCFPITLRLGSSRVDVVSSVFLLVSTVCVTSVALERFVAVVLSPFRYKEMFTYRRCIVISLFCWIIPVVVTIPLSLNLEIFYRVFFVVAPCVVLFELCLTGALYSAIYYTVRKQRRQITVNLPLAPELHQTRRLSTLFALIVGLFPLCWLPMVVIVMVQSLSFGKKNVCFVANVPFYAGLCVGLITSVVNPFIYWWRMPDYKDGTKALCAFLFCKKSNVVDPIVTVSSVSMVTGCHADQLQELYRSRQFTTSQMPLVVG
ncbi:adenosine receptor A2b-like [Patiria miniata]|uniref:G-protein coupled receptors family 1 profile domain-containing protein n=1 Tax=Patiria miniata TaxID=46514 RepID=A0A913YZM3_PATMI|nr:adenosine receptor A2b-like [Patiria miniata]